MSPGTRQAVANLLAATLESRKITDRDLGIYIGCTRDELRRAAAEWSDGDSMPLADAQNAWLLLVQAVSLVPWRRWVPAMPSDALLDAAYRELHEPFTGSLAPGAEERGPY